MNNTLRILLIDDNSDDRALVMHELQREFPDSEVKQITDAPGLACALEASEFDLVITAYRLGWTDGLEVLRVVKARRPECPVIMLACTDTEEIAVKAMKAGLDNYVLKSPPHFARVPVAVRLALGRVQQRQALKEAETRYRSLFDRIPVGFYRTTPEGQVLNVNTALVRMLGYPDRESLLAINTADVYVNSHDHRRWQALMECEGAVRDFEVQCRRLDGTLIWVRDRAQVVCDANDQALYYEGVLEDITEHRQTEEMLERRISQLAILSDIGGKIAAVLELDSVLDRATRLVQESFGYHHVALFTVDSDQGVVAMGSRAGSYTYLFPSDHRLELGQGMVGRVGRHGKTLLANDVSAEPRYVNLYPDVIPTQSELSVPIRVSEEVVGVLDVQSPRLNAFDENDVMVLETLADQIAVAIENARLYEAVQRELTERKQVEEALRRERDFSKSIIETTPALIVVMDTDGCITLFNPACEELTGYAAAEVIEHTLWEFLVPEQFPEQFIHGVQEAFAKLQGDMLPGSYEIPLLTRDGNERWITWTTTNIKDGAGNVVAIVGVGIDVTELRHMQRALERRNRELRALVEAGQVLSGTLDLDEVLDSVLDTVQRQFDLASVSFSSYDPTTQMIEIRAQHYDDPAHQVGQIGDRRKRDQHPYSSRALDTSQLIYEPDLWSAPHIPEERRAEARALNIRSVVEVPLIARGQPVGVLHLRAFETPRFFTDEELAFVRAVAPAAAVAIYNAQLYRRLEQRVQEISTLHHAGQVLTGVIDMEQLLQFVVETAVAMLPDAEKGAIQLYDEESGTLVTRAGVGYTKQELARIYLPLDRSVAGHCFATGKPWIVEDAAADPYFHDAGLPVARTTRSMMAVPLTSKSRSIGVLCVDNLSTTGVFTDDDMRVLSTLASQAAAAIEAARLFTQVDAARTRAEELAVRVVQAQEDERRRIARELHDEVGQLLTGTKLSQEMLVADMPAEPAELRERALENVDLIDETMDVVRKLSLDLRPAALDELGLSAALEWHIERYQHQTGLQVTFRESLFPRQLLDPLATAVYRVVQEALTNIARHALATSVVVKVTYGDRKLSVQVTDDGCGFDVATVLRTGPDGGHFGLVGLQERATLLGGKARIESMPGQGTQITVEFPLPECE